jgi:serine/threonine protein kinase
MRIFIQMALGLNDLHSKQFFHRDIKSNNVFINERDEVKIGTKPFFFSFFFFFFWLIFFLSFTGDFGFLKKMDSSSLMTVHAAGTPFAPLLLNLNSPFFLLYFISSYMAPEIFEEKPFVHIFYFLFLYFFYFFTSFILFFIIFFLLRFHLLFYLFIYFCSKNTKNSATT